MRSSIFCFILMILFIHSEPRSATILKGELKSMEYDDTGNPYIIDSNTTIPKSTRVVFKDGCIVLVKPFCGITVSGCFMVKGTENNPVVFTTINDNKYNAEAVNFPQPLDWNGITVELNSDTVFMENFQLNYSVYGIKSWNSKIIIHNGLFANNGQYDLAINDNHQVFTPDIPYSHNYTPPITIKDTSSFASKIGLYKQRVKKRKVLAIVTFVSSLAGGGVDGYLWYKYSDSEDKYFHPKTTTDVADNRDYDKYRTAGIITAICSGTLLTTSALLYMIPVGGFHKGDKTKQPELKVSVFPGGSSLTLQFPISGRSL